MAYHVMDEANRCLNCKKPMCMEGCPIHTPIPTVISLLKEGKIDDTLGVILIDGRKILIDKRVFDAEVEDLNFCLGNKTFLDNIDFSKKVMFSHEIKSNNNIEGITDDIDVIRGVIEKQKEIRDIEKRNRIINLYKGYQYILGAGDINKESLKELYSILSEGLLSKEESQDMGEYYRTRSGIILLESFFSAVKQGIYQNKQSHRKNNKQNDDIRAFSGNYISKRIIEKHESILF